MSREAILLALGVWSASANTLFGFSSDGSSLTRSYDTTTAITNSPVVVRVTFSNGGLAPLRGFFYSEEVPSPLAVNSLKVTVDGQVITNATLEAGYDGDVYAGYTPWRWRLETPTNFFEAHPLSSQSVVEIAYTLTSSLPGSFACSEFAWSGYSETSKNAQFGCSESSDQRVLHFVTTTNRPAVSAQYLSNGTVIKLQGETGISYLLEASSDLVSWLPLTTNVCCFTFLDTNSPSFSSRWYRGRLFIESR